MYVSENNSVPFQNGYKQGITDAWEAARRIVCYPEDGGYVNDTLRALFDNVNPPEILFINSAEDAIKVISEYEKTARSYDAITVGSEVILKVNRGNKNESVKGVVVKVNENGLVLFTPSDLTMLHISRAVIWEVALTGKTYGDIAEIMNRSDK